MTGHDYLEFVPAAYRGGVRDSVRVMRDHSCGLWQIMALHYERGHAQNFEVTVFPLSGSAESTSLLLGLVLPLDEPVEAIPLQGKAMLVDTAKIFHWIDIGAGVPDWAMQEAS